MTFLLFNTSDFSSESRTLNTLMRSKRKSEKFSRLTKLRVVGVVLSALVLGVGVIMQLPRAPKSLFPPVNQTPLAAKDSSAPPEKLLFTVSVVCGGHVQCERGIRPLRKAIAYLERRLDVKFKIEKVITSDKQPLGTIEERWMQWFEIAGQLGAAKNDLTVVFLEDHPDNIDTFDFEQEGMIGLASGIGVLGARPSAILAKVMGGEQFMTRVLIHEIGHVLGGQHVEEGIMHPCACVNQYSDEFSNFTLAQIKAHLELVRRYRASQPKISSKLISVDSKTAVFENSALMCL